MADQPNWDAQLSKIDKVLERTSDEALLPTPPAAAGSPEVAARAAEQKTTSTWGVMTRVVLAVALGVGMIFWPYSARCGVGLAAYLAAVGVLVGAGVWTSIWTWRHRSARAHLLSLLLIVWGGVLGAAEVLPRVGYATPTPSHPAVWSCE
ncbi:MAG TPA: hypothetical protein VFG84_02700 [Gemmatimonadaceae bacterium]|nr:hypothetical protein [Gemmatimonadaceae bacterium]